MIRASGFLSFFRILFISICCLFVFSTKAYPKAELSDRHIILVSGGLGGVIGRYYFAVNVASPSQEAAPERMRVKLLLPKEVSDFAPAEGVKPEDIKLGEDGGIYVEKDFNPGFNLVGVFFEIKAKGSSVEMTLTPSNPLSELRVISQTKEINFVSSDFSAIPQAELEGDQVFSGIRNNQPLEPGKVYMVTIQGLAQGRAWFWLTGSIFAALMIGVSAFMFFKTRERYEKVGILA